MKAAGMKELVSVQTAAQALGLDPDTPLLGYYFKADLLVQHPGLAQAFYDASREAKDLLAGSDAAWAVIRPAMNATTDAQFDQLRADWIAGIPARGPVNIAGANKLLSLMADLGGAELVGDATAVRDGLFADVN